MKRLRLLPAFAVGFLLGLSRCGPALAQGPEPALKVFDAEGAVRDLALTPDGLLWVATSGGLKRFDGRRFISFPELGEVHDLHITHRGQLLVGASAAPGLFRLQPGTRAFVPHEARLYAPVTAIAETEAGALWLATADGLQLWNGAEHKPISGVSPSHRLKALVAAGEEEAWVGAEDGLLRVNAGTMRHVWRGDSVNAIVVQADGSLLLATERQRLGVFRPDAGSVELGGRGEIDPTFLAIAPLASGEYLFGTGAGALAGAPGRLRTLVGSRQLPNVRVTSVMPGSNGSMWLGTDGGSLVLLGASLAFQARAHVNEGRVVFALMTSRGGEEVWLQEGVAVARLQGGALERFVPPAELKLFGMRPLALGKNGDVWTADEKRGLVKLSDGMFTLYDERQGLRQRDIHCLYVSRSTGTLWMGFVAGGLASYDGKAFMHLSPQQLGCDGAVRGIVERGDETLWAATEKGQLCQVLSTNSLTINRPVLAAPVRFNGLAVAPDDSLWMATEEHGVARFKLGRLSFLNHAKGLEASHVGNMFFAGSGDVWFISRQGAFRGHWKDLDATLNGSVQAASVARYGPADGLPSTSFIWGWPPVAAEDSQGQLWLSTLQGLTTMNSLAHRQDKPSVVIDQVVVNGAAVSRGSASAAGKGAIEFHFTAAVDSSAHHLRWRYRLDGLDDRWFESPDRPSVSYVNLKPGHYVFRAAAYFQGASTTSAEAAFPLLLVPPFYRTWWFLGGASLASFAALMAMVQLRRRQRLRSQKLIWQERQRIARDLHDSLEQSTLAVRFQMQTAARQPAAASVLLDRAGEMLEYGIAEARGLIWALRAEPGSSDLQARLGVVVGELLRGRSIRFEQIVVGTPVALHADTARAVERIVAAATANTLKHANASQITLTYNYGKGLDLMFEDNGQGFDPAAFAGASAHGMGLRGMKERAEAIGAALVLHSSPGHGMRLELHIRPHSTTKPS